MNNQTIFLALVLISCVFSSTAKERPNVIVIISDDQGSIDLNSYGAKDLHTPNLDYLAKSGVRFNQFYSSAPLCSPARAAILTGLTPHAAGLPNNASSIKGTRGMPSNRLTMAEYLKPLGYTTGHIGKWHLGFTPETMPLAQGFDYSFGHMGGAVDNYSHFFYWNGSNRHDLYQNGKEIWRDGEYFPNLMANEADKFIIENSNKAFFLYYAINLPHYPVQPSKKWRDYYQDTPMPRRDYAAFISTMDEKIGQLINTLKKEGIFDNTIVIFQSDHGHSMESRAFGGGSSGEYRGAKTSLFEGGIRVPAIISYPNKISKNQTREQMAVSVDWLPTILDYLDVPINNIDGKSLKKVIEHATPSPHKIFRWKQGLTWAVRKDNWKLIGYPNDPQNKAPLDPENDSLFLVNLANDKQELTNLLKTHPEKTQELLHDYLTWEFADISDIPAEKQQILSIAKKAKVTLVKQPDKRYRANGPSSLVDELLGERAFQLGNWLGFKGDDLTATIDLGKTTHFEQVIVGTLQHAASWIFQPEYIEVSWSDNGTDFSFPIRIKNELSANDNRVLIKRSQFNHENIHARYIKVTAKSIEHCPDWHIGSGQQAWLFIDEISVL